MSGNPKQSKSSSNERNRGEKDGGKDEDKGCDARGHGRFCSHTRREGEKPRKPTLSHRFVDDGTSEAGGDNRGERCGFERDLQASHDQGRSKREGRGHERGAGRRGRALKIGKCKSTRDKDVAVLCIYGIASWIAREPVCSDETLIMNTPVEVPDSSLVPEGCGALFDPSIWSSGLRLRYSHENHLDFLPRSLCMQHKRKKTSSSCLPHASLQQGRQTAQSLRPRPTKDSVYRAAIGECGSLSLQDNPPASEVRMVNET